MDEGILLVTPEMEELALSTAMIAAEKLREAGGFDPFVVLVSAMGDENEVVTFSDVSLEDDPNALVAAFRETVRDMRYHPRLYAACYDGYIRANGQEIDSIVVEFATNTEEEGHAIGLPYCGEGDDLQVEEQATYLGECPTYFFVAAHEM